MADLNAIEKKLPFKPTALRNTRPKPTLSSSTGDDGLPASAGVCSNSAGGRSDEEEDTLALFRRAKEMAPIVEADRKRRKHRQLQKQKEQEEARSRALASSKRPLTEQEDTDTAQATTPTTTQASAMSEDGILATQEEDNRNRELVTPPSSKRSRRDTSTLITKPEDVDLSNRESVQSSPTMRTTRSLAPDRSMTPALYGTSLYGTGASTSTHHAHARPRLGGAAPAGSQVILLESDSEPEISAPAGTTSVKGIEQAATLDLDLNTDALTDEDDDEFSEYVRKAQEQRDKHILQMEQAAAASQLSPASRYASTGLSPAPDNAKQAMDIVVTSEVPGARHVLARICFDRPLRAVRDCWTNSQHKRNVPLHGLLEHDEDVILTWRRKKVYMSSTLLSLGIRPSEDGSGAAVMDGYARDGFNDDRTRVHMEAWTPAQFAQMEREEERRRRRDLSDEPASGAGDNDEEDTAAAVLRVILKTRGGEPVKLRVLPETTTETLVAAFRAQRDVPQEADVGLWFDGLRLEAGATLSDAGIDDMDTIEVHVK
ncbi:Ubiquitin [Cordyceps militaris CM01]|uniref:Ubiquitin n=1 Tax=Cordyceps militaris (strain CM01) TaxID=983644 RepID=G3JHZ6_CORMM|nr:Ubiquitin [Cordyceps militaris CM01]EGX91799.1 Ubiquitin [Cordyceps militaris CM01]